MRAPSLFVNMLVKEVFKQLYQHSNAQKNPLWGFECDCQNYSVFQLVEDLLQVEIVELFKTYKFSEKVIQIVHLHLNHEVQNHNTQKCGTRIFCLRIDV